MRKLILGLALTSLLTLGGCRAISGALWTVPNWIDNKVLQVHTGEGRYDGEKRWDNFGKNYAQIWNFVNIHFFNYDVRDPFLGAPFFGDPR